MSNTREGRRAWNDPQWIRAEIDRLRRQGCTLSDAELAWLTLLTDRERELGAHDRTVPDP